MLDDRLHTEARIRKLFEPFCDSSSPLKIEINEDNEYLVEGIRRFQSFQYPIKNDENGELFIVRRRLRQVEYTPLRELLASPLFGNLSALARYMQTFLRNRLGNTEMVIEGRLAYINESPEDLGEAELVGKPALKVIGDVLASKNQLGTRLGFLHGSPGSGKSWMLMLAAYNQAHRYLIKETKGLYLYIDAQGVNLRSLEQQISYQLDIYNGILRFNEVVPLLRVGALSLIVDGFDEMIMPSGYNDTLDALCSYLESLEGEGSVLASARTTFFHTYDLQSAGVSITQPLTSTTIEVVPWGPKERHDYCLCHDIPGAEEELESIAARSEAEHDLLGRPFVIAQIVNMLREGRNLEKSEVMVAIEEAFIERERKEKLLGPDKNPLLNPDQFCNLLLEISLEMWHLRQTSIDNDSLRILTNMLLEEWGMKAAFRDVISQRMELNPVLQVVHAGTTKAKIIQFPHEILFSRFLARAVITSFQKKRADLLRVLREAPLSDSIREQIGFLSDQGEKVPFGGGLLRADGLLARISELGALLTSRQDDANIRINLGALSAILSRYRTNDKELTLTKCIFNKVSFYKSNLSGIRFVECIFEDVDARNCNWVNVVFEKCPPFQKLEIDRGQQFDSTIPEVLWLVIHEAGKPESWLFGGKQTKPALFPGMEKPKKMVATSTPELSISAIELADLTEKLAKRALRAFWFSPIIEDTDDAGLRKMKRDPQWRELLQLLEKHRLIIKSNIQRQGTKGEVFHLEYPKELLLGPGERSLKLPDNVARFWSELRTI